MNTFGVSAVWCIGQVTVLTVVAAVLYAFTRRTGPVDSRRLLTVSLLLVMLLSLFAASPWPNWNSWLMTERVPVAVTNASVEGAATARSSVEDLEPATAEFTTQSTTAADVSFWNVLRSELRMASDSGQVAETERPRWPAILTIVIAVAASVALLRMLVGLLAGRRLMRSAHRIDDSDLLSIRDELAKSLGIVARVPVYETDQLGVAAAIGHRRPAVLLPSGWRAWSPEQLRAVVAHELSHVASRDYSRWILAQVVTAAHLYHPLVHWLSRRLRVEQELAADAAAARVSGGRTAYLESLAEVLLRQQPALQPRWATPSFLDSRTPLLARLTALKAPPRTGRTRRRVVGGVTLAMLFAAALATAGFRGHLVNAGPPAADAVADAAEARGEASLGAADAWAGPFVDPEALFAVAVRPATILAGPEMQEVREVLAEIGDLSRNMVRVPIEQIDRLLVSPRATGSGNRIAMRMQNRIDPDALDVPWIGDRATTIYKQVDIHHAPGDPAADTAAYLMDDEHTIVFDTLGNLRRFVDDRQANRNPPAWLKPDMHDDGGQVYLSANVPAIKRMLGNDPRRLAGGPALQMLQPALARVESAAASFIVVPSVEARLAFDADTPEGAEVVNKTISALFTLGGNMLDQQIAVAEAGDDEMHRTAAILFKRCRDLIDNVETTTAGAHVGFSSSSEIDTKAVMALVLPAVHAAREAAYRTQSMNNLKQIAIAMHIYADAHGHFPPSVLRDKETGTPYSWRVAILPYLEEADLYERYRRNEPWDSPHNLALVKEMPISYRNPKADADSFFAAYFVPTGDTTIFPDRGEGTRMQKITDGLSKTILAVEARREIPWTKPADIAYDPEKPLPKFGGFHVAGYNAALADGSVRFIADAVDATVLRNLLEAQDGTRARSIDKGPPGS